MLITGVRMREKLRDTESSRRFDKRQELSECERTTYLFEMQMAINPGTADLAHIGRLAQNPERVARVEGEVMDNVVALAVKFKERAPTGDDEVRASHHPSKRKSNAPGDHSNKTATLMPSSLWATGSMADWAKQDDLASLGLLGLM